MSYKEKLELECVRWGGNWTTKKRLKYLLSRIEKLENENEKLKYLRKRVEVEKKLLEEELTDLEKNIKYLIGEEIKKSVFYIRVVNIDQKDKMLISLRKTHKGNKGIIEE